jgi:FAD/FMN-containing dehydrogenase
MELFIQTLKNSGFEGDIDTSDVTRDIYSHDASLFELKPQVVVFPKNAIDIQRLVLAVNQCKKKIPDLSLTARSAGTDMGGGSISSSVLVEFRRYFSTIHDVTDSSAHVQPGVLYKDFEKETLKHHNALLPSFPASRELASVGGMVSNNSGGEKSLEFGKTENFVKQLDVTLADGKTYRIKPLKKPELDTKMKQKDFEGQL